MKIVKSMYFILILILSSNAFAWEANVVEILQHGSIAAIYLTPDPGNGQCEVGQPYLLVVDGTPESNQRFSMLLTALTSGKKVGGYEDECNSGIWGHSRPTIRRLRLFVD